MNNYYIRPIPKKVAKQMIVKNHYSHTIAFGVNLTLGVFEKTDDAHPFFEDTIDNLLGVVIYSIPVGAQVYKTISPLIQSQNEIYELTRLWLDDALGKNSESWAIAESIEYIRKHQPQIKVLISYSDLEQHHTGAIYQATNWIFQGKFQHNNMMFSFDEGKSWRHNKGLRNVYDGLTDKQLIEKLPKPLWVKKASPKYRYIFPVGNKIWRKRLTKTLVYPPLPYPKEAEYTDATITKYE